MSDEVLDPNIVEDPSVCNVDFCLLVLLFGSVYVCVRQGASIRRVLCMKLELKSLRQGCMDGERVFCVNGTITSVYLTRLET
jgi:hypothetical protein